MTSRLDGRQRAMLAEMAIKVWAPPSARARAPDDANLIAESVIPALAEAVKRTEKPKEASPPPPPVLRPAAPVAAPVAAPAAGAALGARPEGIEGMDWPALEAAVAGCRACGLCAGRTNTVFGVGSRQAGWMIVGEAPGENEDRQGQPFVGQAGRLLDNMLAAVGRSRQAGIAPDSIAVGAVGVRVDGLKGPEEAGSRGVYIANVLKCRPPGNRNPQPDEVAQCEPYLRRQVALVRPRLILAMGRFAVQSLLRTQDPIGRLRGRVHHYEGVPVIVTYHPAYLLRALPEKAKAWQDLCLALEVDAGAPA